MYARSLQQCGDQVSLATLRIVGHASVWQLPVLFSGDVPVGCGLGATGRAASYEPIAACSAFPWLPRL
jgi:hypothetical protein